MDDTPKPPAHQGPQRQPSGTKTTPNPPGTPPPSSPPNTPTQEKEFTCKTLGDAASVASMCGSVGPCLTLGGNLYAFTVHRATVMEEFGNPTDPLLVMLIEQLALAHLNVGRLMRDSSTAKDPAAGVAFSGAAVRLMGEVRRTTITLDMLRAKIARRAQRAAEAQEPQKRVRQRNRDTSAALGPPETTIRIKLEPPAEVVECLPNRSLNRIASTALAPSSNGDRTI